MLTILPCTAYPVWQYNVAFLVYPFHKKKNISYNFFFQISFNAINVLKEIHQGKFGL